MFFTDEQKNIIDDSPDFIERKKTVVISARPGTGKSTTLRSVAQANPEKKFLYLSVMREGVEQNMSKMPKNCDVYTTYGFALKHTKLNGVNIIHDYKVSEIADILEISFGRASKVKKLSEKYMISHAQTIAELKHEFDDEIVFATQAYLRKMQNREIDLTQKYYLKEFSFLLGRGKKIKGYDCLMVDEFQDTNPVIASIYKNLGDISRIVVGDPDQSIMGFAGSINGMDAIIGDVSYVLSVNFRSNNEVIAYGNDVLKNILGRPYRILPGREFQDANEIIRSDAIITRTNAALIRFMDYYDNFNTVKDPEEIFSLPIAIHKWLRGANFPKQFWFLSKIKTEEKLLSFARKTNDHKIMGAYLIFRRYSEARLEKLWQKALMQQKDKSGITLLTGHTSKGLEFNTVRLGSDFPDLYRLAKKVENHEISKEELIEEINLYFVAITRAAARVIDSTPNKNLSLEKKHYIQKVLKQNYYTKGLIA